MCACKFHDSGSRRRTALLSAGASVLAAVTSLRAAQPLEPGFAVETYAAGLTEPTALAFSPDGRLFVIEKGGAVRIIADGKLQPTPFATLTVHNFLESGLLGLALDPDFASNRYVYLFATLSFEEQAIFRLTEQDGVGVDLLVIKDKLPSRGTFHNGGCLKFGPDGRLYFSIGDNTEPGLAQQLTTLAGKVCRINPDGTTPDDNPLRTPTGQPSAIYALGFRNPFRFCFAPDGRLFVMDVGSGGEQRREEINRVTAGNNCGWPIVEGQFDTAVHPHLTNPVHAYNDQGSAPTGGVYYTGNQFPAEHAGDLFHLEYTLNRLYRLKLNGDAAVSHTTFVETEGGPTDLAQGPDGALYYCELVGGRVSRVSYVGTAVAEPDDQDDSVADADGVADADDATDSGDSGLPDAGAGICGAGVAAPLNLLLMFAAISRTRSRRR